MSVADRYGAGSCGPSGPEIPVRRPFWTSGWLEIVFDKVSYPDPGLAQDLAAGSIAEANLGKGYPSEPTILVG
ncbi:MAG: hypothetical protein ACYDEY_02345 [Acidimicrobiales bacterium]